MAIDQAALNALTAQFQSQNADLDDQENRYRINYNSVLDKMRRAALDTSGDLNVSMADNGMQQSGPALQGQLKIQTAANTAQAEAAQEQTLNLGTIARKRLEAGNAYNTQRLLV